MVKYDDSNRPICYLDIDGVVYWYPNEKSEDYHGCCGEVRPWLFAFLQTIHDLGFELRLLTCNWRGGKAAMTFVDESHTHTMHRWCLPNIPTCYEEKAYHNGLDRLKYSKAAYIDLNRPFIWFEDGIITTEHEMLESRGWQDRYFEIHAHKPDEFLDAMKWARLKAVEFGMVK